MNVSLQNVESFRIVEILLDILLGDLRSGNALLLRPVDDLVVDIGEVLHELYFIASELEISSQRVKHNKRARVAYMEKVIDRRAADIHFDLARLDRHELLFAVSKRVIDLHFFLLFSRLRRPGLSQLPQRLLMY